MSAASQTANNIQLSPAEAFAAIALVYSRMNCVGGEGQINQYMDRACEFQNVCWSHQWQEFSYHA